MQLTARPNGSCRRWAAAVVLLAVSATSGLAQGTKATYVAEGSFQLPRKGSPGAPDRPAALAVGPDGAVHIADLRGAIFVFEKTGIFRRSYGESQLRNPIDIEITPSGESYVLDDNTKQVLVFGPEGQPLRALAGPGSRGGQLSKPLDMALGPSGYVYVLDAGRGGIQILSRDGTFVRDIDPGQAIREARSLAVGSDGRIYVADKRSAENIFVLPPFTDLPWIGPVPRGVAGLLTYRGAEFSRPVATIVNDFGTVVVLDKTDRRLWRRNITAETEPGPNDVLYGGIGTGRGSFRDAVDVAFVGEDEVVVLDAQLRKVERIRLTTEADFAPRPAFDFPVRVTRGMRSLPSPLLNVGYGPQGETRLLLRLARGTISLMGTDAELHQTVYGDTVRAYLPNPRVMQVQISQDIGEAANAVLTDTSVVVLDSRRNRFTIFSPQGGAPLGTYGDNYRDDRRLSNPYGLAVLSDGRVVIGDRGNQRVKVFSPDLASLVASFPVAKLAGIAVKPSGEIFAWNQSGSVVSHLPPGSDRFEPLGEGLLPGPVAAITFDQAGNLFALDRATDRITIIKADLSEVLIQLGAENAFDDPDRLTVDRDGNIYISDPGADRTFVYRWDVVFPPLAGINLKYEEDAAVLEWVTGPPGFVAAYDVQGATERDGPYSLIERREAPPYRLDESTLSDTKPRWIRVAPVFITGVTGTATQPYPLFNFTAAAAYRRGDYAQALRDAAYAVDLINDGVLEAENDVKAELLWLAFASAADLGDYRGSLPYAQQLGQMSMPLDQLIQFRFRLAEVYLRLGDAKQASQHILAVVAQVPSEQYFSDPAVVDQSFRVYRGLRASGLEADGIDFLRLYMESMPGTAVQLHEAYEDSISVFSTRAELRPGFEYWNSASFAEVVNFFETMLTTAGLSPEGQVVARQILAAAYYAFGRRSEAEDTFREIYSVRRGFDFRAEPARLLRLYGLTVYNPETQRFFGGLIPRS